MPSPYSYIDFGAGVTDLTSAEQGGLFAPTGLQYIQTDDIYVTVTKSDTGVITTLTSADLTVTETPSLSVQINSGISLPLAASDLVRVGRTTDIDSKARDFTDGSVLKASDLNTQNNQFLYSIQESLDTGTGALPIVTDGSYDAGGRRIKNLGTSIDDNDAISYGTAYALLVYGAATEPQGWSFDISNFTTSGSDLTVILDGPVPTSAVDNTYLVEIGGITQIPTTDYTITQVADVYTLTLVGAVAAAYGSTTPVMVRNFGAARNIQVTPYKVPQGSLGSDSLQIERVAGQTGNLIHADDESDNSLFRVDAEGQVIIGEDGTYGVTSASLSTTALEVGNVDTSQNDPFYYGVKLQTASNDGLVEILGAAPASIDPAFKIYEQASNGTVTTVLEATYGGALTITGMLTADAVLTQTLNVQSTSIFQDDISINDGKKISIGTNKLEILNDGLNDAKRIELKSSQVPSSGADGDKGIYSPDQTGTTYGHIGLTGLGSPFMGMGGIGTGFNFGGPGSFSFDYNGNHRSGPVIRVNSDQVLVTGYRIPTTQGGAANQNGDTRAGLYIDQQGNEPWPTSGNDHMVMTKKQIDARIPAGHYASHPSSFDAGGTVLVPMVQGIDHFYNPGSNIGYNQPNHRFNITEGVWQLKITIPEYGAASNVGTGEVLTVRVQDIINSSPPTAVNNNAGNGTTSWAFLTNGRIDVPIHGFYRDSPLILNCVVGLFTPGSTPSGSPSGGPLNNANYHVRAIAYTSVSGTIDCQRCHVELTRVE